MQEIKKMAVWLSVVRGGGGGQNESNKVEDISGGVEGRDKIKHGVSGYTSSIEFEH